MIIDHLLIICWLSVDFLMIICWLSVDYLLIICWFPVDYLMIICWFPVDYLLIICRFLLIICWLSVDYLLITCWKSFDFLLGFCWFPVDYLMIICWLTVDNLSVHHPLMHVPFIHSCDVYSVVHSLVFWFAWHVFIHAYVAFMDSCIRSCIRVFIHAVFTASCNMHSSILVFITCTHVFIHGTPNVYSIRLVRRVEFIVYSI